jgi:hypothetical protein
MQGHKYNTENSKQILLGGLSLNYNIHVSLSDLYIPMIGLPILLQENMLTDSDNICINRSQTHANVEIGTEAAQFPEKEYINGIFVAVQILVVSLLLQSCALIKNP